MSTRNRVSKAAIALMMAAAPAAWAGATLPVTSDNFVRAESDRYFAAMVRRDALGKFDHNREPTPLDDQTVIRMNRDTLYSAAVFDLAAGPATIHLPDPKGRFLSMQVINEDHYTSLVAYGGGVHTLTRDDVGTRYAFVAVRILADPSDPKDLDRVHELQDAMMVEQRSAGRFEVPEWDPKSHSKVRDALLELGSMLSDTRRMFGARGEVDPVRHLIGSALAWGGLPDKEALYLNVTPSKNDGMAVYRLTVDDVPVDGFWSVSVYNAKGYFERNDQDAYTINNITAKKNERGAVTIQFGGCDGRTPNCLPITPGWNYMVRLYRPREEILDGTWKFPEATAVDGSGPRT